MVPSPTRDREADDAQTRRAALILLGFAAGALGLVALAAAGVYALWPETDPQPAQPTPPAALELPDRVPVISAATLFDAYRENRLVYRDFNGAWLGVIGRVADIGGGAWSGPVVQLSAPGWLSTIECKFTLEQLDHVKQLRTGDVIGVAGHLTGLGLAHCRIFRVSDVAQDTIYLPP